MSKWLFSVVGIVFLGVLFDMIYPNGKTNSFCKSLFGVFTIYALISPLLQIDFKLTSSDSFIDVSIVESINKSKNDALILKIENGLKTDGIYGVFVEIDCDMTNNEYVVEKIYIDITNIVLDKNYENINIYEVITDKIIKLTGVDSERILIYG